MTMPSERTRAVLQAAELLRELMNPEETPGVPCQVRQQARRLLRHFPSARDMELAHLACPRWFGSPKELE